MKVFLVPSNLMIPNDVNQVVCTGFIAEVKEVTSEALLIETTSQSGELMQISLEYVTADLYKWCEREYTVWKSFNAATGDASS